jgi:hypothetical protein
MCPVMEIMIPLLAASAPFDRLPIYAKAALFHSHIALPMFGGQIASLFRNEYRELSESATVAIGDGSLVSGRCIGPSGT